MFSTRQKQLIAQAVEDAIEKIGHPEMDNDNIRFDLHVFGREEWSWADIHENSRKPKALPNIWNEIQDKEPSK